MIENYRWTCPAKNADGSPCGFEVIGWTQEGLDVRVEMHLHATHMKSLPGKIYDPNKIEWTPTDLMILKKAKISPE